MTKRKIRIYKTYRRYECDPWGDLYKKAIGFKLYHFFSFVLEKTQKDLRKRKIPFLFDAGETTRRRDLKKYNTKALFFLEKQKFKKFYGNLSEQEFKELANAITYRRRRRHQGYLFVLGLESRLDTLYYRFLLGRNVLEARDVVKEGKLLVNGKVITNFKHRIQKGNIITFSEPKKMIKLWKKVIVEKERRQKKMEPFPEMFWISYKHLLFKYNPTNLPKQKVYYPFLSRFKAYISTYY